MQKNLAVIKQIFKNQGSKLIKLPHKVNENVSSLIDSFSKLPQGSLRSAVFSLVASS